MPYIYDDREVQGLMDRLKVVPERFSKFASKADKDLVAELVEGQAKPIDENKYKGAFDPVDKADTDIQVGDMVRVKPHGGKGDDFYGGRTGEVTYDYNGMFTVKFDDGAPHKTGLIGPLRLEKVSKKAQMEEGFDSEYDEDMLDPDDEDAMYEEPEEDMPSEDDIFVSENGKEAYYANRLIVELVEREGTRMVEEEGAALIDEQTFYTEVWEVNTDEGVKYVPSDEYGDNIMDAIQTWMDAASYYPNVWQQGERGDATLLTASRKKTAQADNSSITVSYAKVSEAAEGIDLDDIMFELEAVVDSYNGLGVTPFERVSDYQIVLLEFPDPLSDDEYDELELELSGVLDSFIDDGIIDDYNIQLGNKYTAKKAQAREPRASEIAQKVNEQNPTLDSAEAFIQEDIVNAQRDAAFLGRKLVELFQENYPNTIFAIGKALSALGLSSKLLDQQGQKVIQMVGEDPGNQSKFARLEDKFLVEQMIGDDKE